MDKPEVPVKIMTYGDSPAEAAIESMRRVVRLYDASRAIRLKLEDQFDKQFFINLQKGTDEMAKMWSNNPKATGENV